MKKNNDTPVHDRITMPYTMDNVECSARGSANTSATDAVVPLLGLGWLYLTYVIIATFLRTSLPYVSTACVWLGDEYVICSYTKMGRDRDFF